MMNKKIRILAIAPYESMRTVMLETVKEFEEIDLTVFVGDLVQGVLIAQDNFYNDYDIIVSRGGTASMLKERLNLPIVEIEVSPLDILRAMKMGEDIANKYAVIGFPNITRDAQMICQIMDTKIDIYSIHDVDEVEDILHEISEKGAHAILCDMCAYTIAGKFGLNPVLLQSGQECIRNAFFRARQLYMAHQKLREENRFLRSLIWKQINKTIVFDGNGSIFFSTLENNNAPIVAYLRSECGREMSGEDNHIIKQISNVRYSIRMSKDYFDNTEYTVYCYTESKVSLPDIRRGVRYMGQPEAEAEYNESMYGIAGLPEEAIKKIGLLNQGDQPLLIFGEDGTCKEQAVKYIYLNSRWRMRPLVIVDCFMLNQKAWDYLMDHHNSPLAQSDCSIFIKNVDVLTAIQRKQLLANLLEMNVCRRNRVIFSCVSDRQGIMSAAGRDLLETLSCMALYLPPLPDKQEAFELIVNKYLNYSNVRFPDPLTKLTPESMKLLMSYDWPHNYTQLQRVLDEIFTMNDHGVIHEEDVRSVLRKERTVAVVNDKAEDADVLIDLNQPLDKINYDIIRKVLEEEHGNRTNAANRLGISRSTMWRILKSMEA